jgi:hypothetical protein
LNVNPPPNSRENFIRIKGNKDQIEAISSELDEMHSWAKEEIMSLRKGVWALAAMQGPDFIMALDSISSTFLGFIHTLL